MFWELRLTFLTYIVNKEAIGSHMITKQSYSPQKGALGTKPLGHFM